MVDENVGEQLWQPPFDGIGVAFYKGADPENGSVTLTKGVSVCRVSSIGEIAVLGEAYKPILKVPKLSHIRRLAR